MNRKTQLSIVAMVLSALATGCGSDTAGDLDLNGRWRMSISLASNDCGAPNGSADEQEATITQSGSQIQIRLGEDEFALTGTLSGKSLSLSGSTSQEDCLGTLQVTFVGSATETRITGTLSAAAAPNPLGCAAGSRCTLRYNLILTR